MVKHNAYRDGKVHVCKVMCKTCIFHPGNRMDLSPGRVDKMIVDAEKKDSAIICHSTLTGDNAVCRGFYENHSTYPLRLARVMGVVEEIDPPKLGVSG